MPFSFVNAKKNRHRKPGKCFEMMPDRGVLEPGKRENLQIKFMPIEEVQ